MAVSTATKAGAVGLFAAGVPGSLYLASDHIFLYEEERTVIYDTGDLSESDISGSSSSGETNIKKFHSSDNKWSCSIKAKLDQENGTIEESSKTSLISYIKGKINSSDANIKKSSRKNLVWACSKERTKTDASVNSELTILLKKVDSKLMISLFGIEEEVKSS